MDLKKMNRIVFVGLIVIAIILIWIFSNPKKSLEESKEIETGEVVLNSLDENKEFERLVKDFETLYKELIAFKGKSDFATFGLGAGGPYGEWFGKVKRLSEDPYSNLLLRKEIAPNDLIGLATEYISTKGRENEYTRTINTIIKLAFIPEENIEEEIIQQEIEEENKVDKTEYQPWGKWYVKNKYNAILNQEIEIFSDGGNFYSIVTYSDNSHRRETLRKEGDKFIIVGNRSGEYYKITPGINKMTLHDRQGLLDMFEATNIPIN